MLKNGDHSEATLYRVDNGINETEMSDRIQEFIDLSHSQLRGSEGDKEIRTVSNLVLNYILRVSSSIRNFISKY